MARNKRKKKHGGGPAVASDPDAILAEVALVAERIAADPDAAGSLWGDAHRVLLRAKAEPADVGRVVATRDVGALERLVASLRGEECTEPAPAAPEVPAADVPAETLKKAMRAFRKRDKLVRLDHESRLGVGPMTGGRKAEIDAIIPPMEFATEVWDALVAAGKLKRMGPGFYGLIDEAPET